MSVRDVESRLETLHFYSMELTRTYKQDDQFKDSNSFSGSELLRIARLANIAYDEIAIMRAKEGKQDADNGGSS